MSHCTALNKRCRVIAVNILIALFIRCLLTQEGERLACTLSINQHTCDVTGARVALQNSTEFDKHNHQSISDWASGEEARQHVAASSCPRHKC